MRMGDGRSVFQRLYDDARARLLRLIQRQKEWCALMEEQRLKVKILEKKFPKKFPLIGYARSRVQPVSQLSPKGRNIVTIFFLRYFLIAQNADPLYYDVDELTDYIIGDLAFGSPTHGGGDSRRPWTAPSHGGPGRSSLGAAFKGMPKRKSSPKRQKVKAILRQSHHAANMQGGDEEPDPSWINTDGEVFFSVRPNKGSGLICGRTKGTHSPTGVQSSVESGGWAEGCDRCEARSEEVQLCDHSAARI